MNRRDVLMSLQSTPGIGWLTIQRLATRISLQDLASMDPPEVDRLAGIGLKRAKLAVCAAREESVEKRKRALAKHGIRWVALGDPGYPRLLRETDRAPWVLFYKGNAELLHRPCLAVVGTRVPTYYGKKTAELLSRELSECGITIVSGLARGIDSHAHAGALEGDGKTIAVTANPLNEVYPPENKALFRRIEREGLLVTETPLESRVRPGLFPLRNRLIAGLSLGVMVVEAGIKSGTKSTVDYCAKYNRDLFAVPGPIHSPKSAYPLELIKRNGAKLVACCEDVLEELPPYVPVRRKKTVQPQAELTEHERFIVEILKEKPRSIDELLHISKFTFGHLHSVLLSLTMKHQIEQLPGSVYQIRIQRD